LQFSSEGCDRGNEGSFRLSDKISKSKKKKKKKKKTDSRTFPFYPPLMSKSRASNGERKTEEQKRKKSFKILNSHVGTRCDQYFL
jgi:hypothetical protein